MGCGWQGDKMSITGGGALLEFVCVSREGKWALAPLLPTPGRLRPETLIMLQRRDRLEHPSALQGLTAQTHTHSLMVQYS